MSFNKVFLLCCIVAPLATLASQPRGKFGGTHARQQTKKDLRVGPECSQQHKQGVWEILQAKKMQKAFVQERTETALVQKQSFAKVFAPELPTMRERQHDASSFRPCSAYPVTTAILFTLLFVACPARAAVNVKPGPRGLFHNGMQAWEISQKWDQLFVFGGDGRINPHPVGAYIIDECIKYQNFNAENKPQMSKELELAKQYADAKCPTDFPAFPMVECDTVQHFYDVIYGHIHGNLRAIPSEVIKAEHVADTLIDFINRFNRKSEDFHACLTQYLERERQREKVETERRIAQTELQNAELARQNTEIIRQNAELAKQYAEIMHQNAEIIRIKTEEQNRDAIRRALAVIKEINEYMNEHMRGINYQFNPRYQEAFDFFLKNPEHCISNPDEECKRELASIHNIEVIRHSATDEEFIRELTGIDLKEQSTCL